MKIPSRALKLSSIALSVSLAVCVCVLFAAEAQASGRGLSDVTARIGTNVRESVPLVPMLSYVCGVFFAAAGLLKLKDWATDGERNPLTPALVRLVVATFLIVLPHMMRITTGSFFRRSNGDMSINVQTPAPRLGAFCKSGTPNCN